MIYQILTENGFKDFLGVTKKTVNLFITIGFSEGKPITVTPTHRFKIGEEFVLAQDIDIGMTISPTNQTVTSITVGDGNIEVYDVVDVDGGNHFLTDGVTSHNCEFLSSDLTLFDSYAVSQAEREVDARIKEICQYDTGVDEDDYVPSYPFKMGTSITMWKRIEKGKTYIVGVDPATGSGEDYTVFEVFEFPSMFQTMEFRSNTMSSPVAYTQLKNILNFIEKTTPEVFFSIENNGVGNGMISLYEADENAPINAHFVNEGKGKALGLRTTEFTKVTTALKFKELFERRNMILNSKILMHEMKNYARKDGSYAGTGGVNDDCISAVIVVIRIIEEMATYNDEAYVRMNNVDAQIEMEGRWDYNEEDLKKSLRYGVEEEEEDDDWVPMPMIIG
jgi:hypothetical protein